MPERTPLQILIFTLILIVGLVMAYVLVNATGNLAYLWVAVIVGVIGLLVAASFKIADQWERAVVLRLGTFRGLQGPGPFFIIPLVERVAYWIDHRIITTTFKAEKTLTKDTVPVDVEAVLFWKVVNTEKAALAVEDYRSAISWASQTALREVIGKSYLADMLEGREKLDKELQAIIDLRTEQWGVKISSVEIRDILIPTELQDAMSMQAQAERERQARVILGDSEKQVAEKFEQASQAYIHNPTALHLRAMNMLFEGLKTRGAMMVVVPASILDSMTLGDTTGIVALARTVADKEERKEELGEGGQSPPAEQKGKKQGY
jgi:regulator of protease activity HflC (stomatin/prohibitin superfamily)